MKIIGLVEKRLITERNRKNRKTKTKIRINKNKKEIMRENIFIC